jgi:hypothetical protein
MKSVGFWEVLVCGHRTSAARGRALLAVAPPTLSTYLNLWALA